MLTCLYDPALQNHRTGLTWRRGPAAAVSSTWPTPEKEETHVMTTTPRSGGGDSGGDSSVSGGSSTALSQVLLKPIVTVIADLDPTSELATGGAGGEGATGDQLRIHYEVDQQVWVLNQVRRPRTGDDPTTGPRFGSLATGEYTATGDTTDLLAWLAQTTDFTAAISRPGPIDPGTTRVDTRRMDRRDALARLLALS